MGSNASVLQWLCDECKQINPTEKSTCLRCNIRRPESNGPKISKNLGTVTVSAEVDQSAHSAKELKKTEVSVGCDSNTEDILNNLKISKPPTASLNGQGQEDQPILPSLADLTLLDGCKSSWECGQCQHLNSSSSSNQCEKCGSKKPNDAVVIQEVDTASLRRAKKSFSVKTLDVKTLTAEEMKRVWEDTYTDLAWVDKIPMWTCTRCTFTNPTFMKFCKMCHEEMPQVEPQQNSDTTDDDAVEVPEVGSPEKKKQLKTWICPKCTLENPEIVTQCQACLTSLTPKETISDSVKKQEDSKQSLKSPVSPTDANKGHNPIMKKQKMIWKCPRCTLENCDEVADCGACGYLRTPKDILINRSSGEDVTTNSKDQNAPLNSRLWRCRRCTLENSATAHICEACGSKREVRLPSEEDIADFDATVILSDTSPSPMKPPVKNEVPGTSATNTPKMKKLSDGWVCPRCTFVNMELKELCEMCAFKNISPVKKIGGAKGKMNSPKPRTPKGKASIPNDNGVPERPYQLMRQKTMRMEDLRMKEEREAQDMWRSIREFCRVNGERFVDDSFPPGEKSLYYNIHDASADRPVIQWLRPHDIEPFDSSEFNIPITVFRTPLSTDIVQGVLGNCWFLCALAVMAERTQLLERIVMTKEYCKEGVYLIRLCLDGSWRTVLVDDFFPCDTGGHQLYSQTRRRQLWVALIEKALAKVNGCYEALVAGRCVEGLCTLTGSPCESLFLQNTAGSEDVDEDLTWGKMLSYQESKFLMGASCGVNNIDDKEYKEVGLAIKHAYSILNVKNVEGHRLVQLRNPWGRFSWKGDWSDSSQMWNQLPEQHRHDLMPHGAEEGVFWISLKDMSRYFGSIDICKYRPDWMEVRMSGRLLPNTLRPFKVTNIEVFQNTEVEFGLIQEGSRSQAKSQRSPVDLCLVVMNAGGRVRVHSKRQVKSFVGCNDVLEPGKYTVVCMAFNHWKLYGTDTDEQKAPKYVLSLHSSKGLLAEQERVPQTIMADTIIQMALAKGSRHEGREGMTTYYLTHGWSGFIVVIENRQPNDVVHAQCDCEQSINVVSTRGRLQTADVIPPLHRQVIMVLTQLEGTSQYSVNHKLVHRSASKNRYPDLDDWGKGQTHIPPMTPEIEGLHGPRPL